MATTTNYSWSTPDDTALVKDGAAAIRSLGSAIDSTVFTNASAAIAKTIVDAKGDIIAATAADTVSRVAVGSNGQVLTADSTAATGVAWATASSVTAFTSKLAAATTQMVRSGTTTSGTESLFEDETVFTPILVSSITADRIAIATSATFTLVGSCVVRLGIYSNNSATNVPGNLVLDAGTVSPTASSTLYTITISQALPAGLYWLGANMQTAGTGSNNFAASTGAVAGSPLGITGSATGVTLFTGTQMLTAYKESGVAGAFANVVPANLSRVIASSGSVNLGLRY